MRVAELMHTHVVTISPDASIGALVQSMADTRVSGLPVVDRAGRVIGVVSATDVLQAAAEKDDAKAKATLFERTMVSEIMTPAPQMIAPDADAREAAQQMLYTEVRRLFVEHDGKLVGGISQTDIAFAVGLGRL